MCAIQILHGRETWHPVEREGRESEDENMKISCPNSHFAISR